MRGLTFDCHLCGHEHDARDELLALPNVCSWCADNPPGQPHCSSCGRGISEVLTPDDGSDIVCMVCVAESLGL